MSEIQLPDYLPSQYPNWFQLYMDIVKSLEDQGGINEETTIKLYEMGSREEQLMFKEANPQEVIYFYQHFPITLIKSRALDFILSKLPNSDIMYRLWSIVMYQHGLEREDQQTMIQLMDVCKIIK